MHIQTAVLCDKRRRGDSAPRIKKNRAAGGRGTAQDTPKNIPSVIVFLLYLVLMIASIVSDLKNLGALKPIY